MTPKELQVKYHISKRITDTQNEQMIEVRHRRILHTKRRFRERFQFDLSTKFINSLCEEIYNGRYINKCRLNQKKSLVLIKVKNKPVYCIFNRKSLVIMTVYTEAMARRKLKIMKKNFIGDEIKPLRAQNLKYHLN